MSKKLSQEEIDALVQRMLAGEPIDEVTSTAGAEAATQAAPEAAAEAGAKPAAQTAPQPAAPQPAAQPADLDPTDVQALVASLVAADAAAPASQPSRTASAAPSGGLGMITQEEIDALLAAAGKTTLITPLPPSDQVGMPAAQSDPPVMAPPAGPGSPAPTAPSECADPAQLLPMLYGPMGELLLDIQLTLTAELVRTKMPLQQLVDLQLGSVIELNRLADEPVDILIGGLPMMKAKVVTIGEQYGVQIIESRLNLAAS